MEEPMAVRSVIIEGLFGRKTAEVQLIDNRVILIGNNGIGKTTIINCIFAFLARRWDRLFANPISAIRIEFNDGTNLYVTRNDFERHNELSQFSPNSLTIKAPSMLKRRSLQWSTLATWLSERNDPTIMRQLASRFDTSEVVFRNWLDSVDVAVESESALYRVEKYLHNKNFSVMFFPTYRKVEKDLKAILTTRD
jgi:predicted ATP-binding protein involved in virulence